MTVIPSAERRRSETPNAVMTTLASPTLGGARQALWRVEMRRGAAGPAHAFDAEQLWTVIAGTARFEVGPEIHDVEAGDTVVIPAGVTRQVVAGSAGLEALVTGSGAARAVLPDGTDRGVPAWVA